MDTKKIELLHGYKGDDRVISSHEMLKQISGRPLRELSTGFKKLDEYIDGFIGGELTAITGMTGEGKTLLAQSLTRNFLENNHYSQWFTYEVRPSQFLYEFGSSEKDIPLFYMPLNLKSNALDWIEERIVEGKLKYNIKAFFIDHLHFIVNMNSKNNISLEIGTVMRRLKNMCVDYNVCGFIIAHTQKLKLDKEKKEPSIDDMRDSSFIGQESDNVFIVWRVKNSDDEAGLKIAKNRRMGVRDKRIALIKKGYFLEEKVLPPPTVIELA